MLTDKQKREAYVDWRLQNGHPDNYYIDDPTEILLPVQDKLSREDERKKFAEWLGEQTNSALASRSVAQYTEGAVKLLLKGQAPWEGKPLEGSDG